MIYANNKQVRFNYEILETFEAGIVLSGPEVKSVRAGKISLKESYVKIKNNELWLMQSHISEPSHINIFAKFDPVRERKLLMHKQEIVKLNSKIKTKGLTLVVVKIYQPNNTKKIKLEIALARGKKLHDKKQVIKERDIKRETDRILKNF